MIWRTYWLCFISCLLVSLLVIAHLAAAPMAPRPYLPILSRSFLAEYSAAGSDTAHDIFLHGLFNVGDRLRVADVFLVGSSHFEFGLSAAELGTLLSKKGHAVRAFNLALGCGETAGFGLEILAKNRISNRSVIAEPTTLTVSGARTCASQSEGRDVFQAYVSVLKIWARYLWDWALDPVLPRFAFATDGVHVQRSLSGMLIERDWGTGDIVLAWHPVGGAFYPDHPSRETDIAEASRTLGVNWQIGDGQITVAEPLRQQAAALGVDLTMSFLPWARSLPDFDKWYQTQFARIQIAPSENTRCFVAIPVDGLTSWDSGNHLTGKSRLIATKRLAAGFETRSCVSASDGSNFQNTKYR